MLSSRKDNKMKKGSFDIFENLQEKIKDYEKLGIEFGSVSKVY